MEQNKEDMKMLRPTATSVRAEEGYILDVEFDKNRWIYCCMAGRSGYLSG